MTGFANQTDRTNQQNQCWPFGSQRRCPISSQVLCFRNHAVMACWLAMTNLSVVAAPFETVPLPRATENGSFESVTNEYESVLIGDALNGRAPMKWPHDQAIVIEESQVEMGDGMSWDGAGVTQQVEVGDIMPADQAVAQPLEELTQARVVADAWWGSCADFVDAEFLGGHAGCGYGGHGSSQSGPACGMGCHGGCRPGAKWALQAEALVLWRGAFGDQTLLVNDIGVPALDAGNVRTPAAAGPRIGILRSLGCGRALEGSYFNVGGIQGQTSTTGIGAPYTAVGLADLPFNDIQSGQYTTRGQIKSAEVNYRWGQGSRIVWLTGFRWIEWNETGSVDYEFLNPLPFGNGSVQGQVGNDLYGGQFGGQFWFLDWGKWQMNVIGKAGAYGNTAYQQTSVTGGVPPQPTLRANNQDVSFFGEVGLNSTVWLTPWLAWRAGYSFFWLEGVATAAEQLPLGSFGTGTTSINTNGSVFLQGFSTGLEARW